MPPRPDNAVKRNDLEARPPPRAAFLQARIQPRTPPRIPWRTAPTRVRPQTPCRPATRRQRHHHRQHTQAEQHPPASKKRRTLGAGQDVPRGPGPREEPVNCDEIASRASEQRRRHQPNSDPSPTTANTAPGTKKPPGRHHRQPHRPGKQNEADGRHRIGLEQPPAAASRPTRPSNSNRPSCSNNDRVVCQRHRLRDVARFAQAGTSLMNSVSKGTPD